jgi:hypothetical protein
MQPLHINKLEFSISEVPEPIRIGIGEQKVELEKVETSSSRLNFRSLICSIWRRKCGRHRR